MDEDMKIVLERYLIETPHTDRECQMLVDQIYAMGYLRNFEWGCRSGVHSGWAIIDAENEDQAKLAVPSIVRGKARVIRLNQFSDADIEQVPEVAIHYKQD